MPKLSKVQPFDHLPGTAHISVIATLAETTTEAVFEYCVFQRSRSPHTLMLLTTKFLGNEHL